MIIRQPKINSYFNARPQHQQQQQQHQQQQQITKKRKAHDSIEMSWANVDGKVIHVDKFDKTQKNAQCLVCKGNVSHRVEHQRYRNGIRHSVRSHFFHLSSNEFDRTIHTNESIEHKAAKAIIRMNHVNINYQVKCVNCDEMIILQFDNDELQEEYSFNDNDDSYRADIGILDETKTLTGVIEVFMNHKIGSKKANTMTKMGLAW